MPRIRQARPDSGLSGLAVAILDALPSNLYVLDRDLRIVAWNSVREKGPLGRPRRTVLGRHLRQILARQGFDAALPALRHVFETGTDQEETLESEGERLFHVRRLPVRQGRKLTHVLCWFEDITDRRAMEMRVIANDRLAFLGQLVAGVAHELSNPLAGIAGCAEALASLALGAPGRGARREAREFRDLIRGEVERCERIVRSLLDSARPNPETTAPLAETVGTTLRLLERHPAFARTRITLRIPRDLPAARIDPDSLKQVVIALAVNAARAMPAGGTLTLRGMRVGRKVVLDVTDTGPGVPAHIRRRIFDPYFTTDPTRGAGLGLAIARSLVRGRGGDLAYRPRPRARGSFRVTFKAAGGRV